MKRLLGCGVLVLTTVVAIMLGTVIHALAQVTVTAIDLGSLGGTYSYPRAMNDKGQVVGWSETVTGGPKHAFLWSPNSEMVDLGTLGGTESVALDVNATGQIVGSSYVADGTFHAFFWTPSAGMVDLGTLGGYYSEAWAINDAGVVAGWSLAGDASRHAFVWTPTTGMIAVGPPQSTALYINERGQVAVVGDPAFLWTAREGMVDLGILGGFCSYPLDINSAGRIVGVVSTSCDTSHAFSWTQNRGMVDLGTLGGTMSAAVAVSDSGQIAGWSYLPGDAGPHAFFWSSMTGMVDIGTLGGAQSVAGAQSFAYGVNNSGQVVGDSISRNASHGYVWTARGGMVDLPPLEGYPHSSANLVNNSGLIVGVSYGAAPLFTFRATLWRSTSRQ